MAKNMDRRIRKTRAQLRQGLAELLKEKSIKEITVKELVEKVDINRSTFYLHYTDIYDMMEKIENELTGEIEDLIHTHPVSPFNEDSFPFIEDIFSILAENRDICAALLGSPSLRKTGTSAPPCSGPTATSPSCTGSKRSSPSTA